MSSPHARGSSAIAAHPAGANVVLPARAGVIPARARRESNGVCPPRTRGGHPVLPGATIDHVLSSPHARGSSLGGSGMTAVPLVLPARAGVIRRPRRRPWHRSRPPRTRGGHPSRRVGHPKTGQSSPHARGSSRVEHGGALPVRVLPARAGVIRRGVAARGRLMRPPRTRGGHPYLTPDWPSSVLSSPHARGSSEPGAGGLRGVPVLPARAGVIPDRCPRCAP